MSTLLKKGVALAKQAVEHDTKGSLNEALACYIASVEHFMSALKHQEIPTQSQATLHNQIKMYMSRAEEIKANLKSVATVARKTCYEESDDLEKSILSSIMTKSPNVRWDDIAGLKATKEVLQSAVILPISHPEIFKETGVTPWNSVLLYGPPGTGKSMLAKAVATECKDSCFFSISSSDVVSKYQGESERLIKALFSLARKRKPSVIFIDEIDSLCRKRTDEESTSTRSIKTQIMVQMDGVGNDNSGVIIIGATNVPWEIDDAVTRRFSKKVHVPPADAETRQRILIMKLQSTKHSLREEDIQEIVRKTDRMSGSDMKTLLQDACYGPIQECQRATHWHVSDGSFSPCSCTEFPCAESVENSIRTIPPGKLVLPILSMHHFQSSLKNTKPTSSGAALRRFQDWEKELGMSLE